MKNKEKWKPTKFIYKNGKLVASRNPKEVSPASRLAVDCVAQYYDIYIQQHVKGKLLDLGCGNVPFFEAYRNYITDNICADWGNTFHKNEYLDMECDLNEPLPFQNEEFDTILLSDVLEHIAQPEQLWGELYRILANHGKIIMNVPFFYWIHEEPYDYYRYTEFALRRFLNLVGFKLVFLEAVGGVPEIIADISAKTALRIPKLGQPLAIFIQAMTQAFLKTRFGKKRSRRTKDTFPLGYFLIAEKSY